MATPTPAHSPRSPAATSVVSTGPAEPLTPHAGARIDSSVPGFMKIGNQWYRVSLMKTDGSTNDFNNLGNSEAVKSDWKEIATKVETVLKTVSNGDSENLFTKLTAPVAAGSTAPLLKSMSAEKTEWSDTSGATQQFESSTDTDNSTGYTPAFTDLMSKVSSFAEAHPSITAPAPATPVAAAVPQLSLVPASIAAVSGTRDATELFAEITTKLLANKESAGDCFRNQFKNVTYNTSHLPITKSDGTAISDQNDPEWKDYCRAFIAHTIIRLDSYAQNPDNEVGAKDRASELKRLLENHTGLIFKIDSSTPRSADTPNHIFPGSPRSVGSDFSDGSSQGSYGRYDSPPLSSRSPTGSSGFHLADAPTPRRASRSRSSTSLSESLTRTPRRADLHIDTRLPPHSPMTRNGGRSFGADRRDRRPPARRVVHTPMTRGDGSHFDSP